MLLLLTRLLTLALALAAPPLVPAADLAGPGLAVWWREGDLLVGAPQTPGRSGIRPLVDLAPMELPADLSGWKQLGARCRPNPTATVELSELPVVAELVGTPEEPVVQLRTGGRVVSSAALGRPARACEIAVAQADELPGLEVIVVWRPLDEADDLRGVAVYHIPEIAR